MRRFVLLHPKRKCVRVLFELPEGMTLVVKMALEPGLKDFSIKVYASDDVLSLHARWSDYDPASRTDATYLTKKAIRRLRVFERAAEATRVRKNIQPGIIEAP